MSQVGILALVVGFIPMIGYGLISLGIFSLPFDLGISPIMLVPAGFVLPLLIIGIGVMIPNSASSNRLASLKIEIPYASMYISVMVSGGLSPFEAFVYGREGYFRVVPR